MGHLSAVGRVSQVSHGGGRVQHLRCLPRVTVADVILGTPDGTDPRITVLMELLQKDLRVTLITVGGGVGALALPISALVDGDSARGG